MLIWLAPLVVFGLVVFVHELGHFLAAKAMGVYAPRFSIGFGPALWRRRWGETEYVLALLPLGGYVRMASNQDQATAFLEGGSEERDVPEVGGNAAPPAVPSGEGERDWDPNAMKPFGPKPIPDHRWFESKPLIARLFILIAGVTMNVILALAIDIGTLAVYGRPYIPAVVDSVFPGRPADRAGLQRGDSIVAIDGAPVTEWQQLLDRVTVSPGRTITLEIVRGGERRTLSVQPEEREVQNQLTGRHQRVGRIGAGPRNEQGREPMTFAQAVVGGWYSTWEKAGGIVDIVRGIFAGDVSTSQLGGPIAIAEVSVQAAKFGLETFLSLIALLSINVAVLNMLPVPILDGGQILLNVLETAKGSAFSARTREYILRAGLLAIALLFALVMFNDIKGIVQRIFL
jgi:regulator of sigma E protease